MQTFVFMCFMLTACAACPSTTPTAPQTAPDASTTGEDVCAQACDVLRAQGCPEGATGDSGVTCETVCRHAQGSGTFDMSPSCIAKQTSVTGVRSCKTVTCTK